MLILDEEFVKFDLLSGSIETNQKFGLESSLIKFLELDAPQLVYEKLSQTLQFLRALLQ